jgi:membrane associated rhomboid family serine protease
LVASFAVIHGLSGRLPEDSAILPKLWLTGEEGAWREVWRFVTYAFFHGNNLHVALNAFGLWIIGSKVERIAGVRGLLKIFLSGVLLGGVVQLFAAPPVQAGVPLVGASGGIAALLLWLTTVSPDLKTWPVKISGKNLGRGILLAEFGFLAFSWFVPEAGFQPVAHACHLGGALAGWAWGKRVFRRLPTLDDLKKERARRESADGPLG